MKKSTAILIIILILFISYFLTENEYSEICYFISAYIMTSSYFIVKILEEKL